MQRRNGKKNEEGRNDEIPEDRRQNYQRDRQAEDPEYTRNRDGIARMVHQQPDNSITFDSYHQQQLQQQFLQFQLQRNEKANLETSRSSNRRMGAVLPSPTPPGSHRSRSSSVPSEGRDRYGRLSVDLGTADTSRQSSMLNFEGSNQYCPSPDTRSVKNSANKGNGAINNVDSEIEDYDEVDATTSTSTTNGKLKFMNKIFDKPSSPSKKKSDKSTKKEKKSSKSKGSTLDSKVPSTNDFDTGKARNTDSQSYFENNRQTGGNPFLQNEDEVMFDNDNDVRQPSRDASKVNIKPGRSSRGLNYTESGLLPGASNSFLSPSELNANYDMIYAEARQRVGNMPSMACSREVLPLPLEIPDSVTDEDAFRRYLSVRRGADCNTQPLPFLSLQIAEQHTNVGSIGERGVKSSSARASIIQTQNKPTSLPPGEAHKRTLSLSHAIMTLALLCASASQLRFFVAYAHAHSYPALNYFLVCTCIIIEILVGIGYLLLSRFAINEERAEQIHSYLIFGLFIVAAANVIICAFALDDHICEVLARNSELFDTVDQSLLAGKMK